MFLMTDVPRYVNPKTSLAQWKINIYFFHEQFIIIDVHLQRVQLVWKLKSMVIVEVRVQTPSVLKFSGLPTQLFKKQQLSRQRHDFFFSESEGPNLRKTLPMKTCPVNPITSGPVMYVDWRYPSWNQDGVLPGRSCSARLACKCHSCSFFRRQRK